MSRQIIVDDLFLSKIAQYINITLNETKALKAQLREQNQKTASFNERRENYVADLKRAADILYDTDFITDEFERKSFLKQATENPSYLVKVLERVCTSNDASFLGKVASVKTHKDTTFNDPVMRRAFGRYGEFQSTSILDD